MNRPCPNQSRIIRSSLIGDQPVPKIVSQRQGESLPSGRENRYQAFQLAVMAPGRWPSAWMVQRLCSSLGPGLSNPGVYRKKVKSQTTSMLSKIFLMLNPCPAVVSTISIMEIALLLSSRNFLRQYSKLPVLSMKLTAYLLTPSSVVFCFSILINCRFCGFDLMLWIMGKENFPSVRSSQSPLFEVYSVLERFM